MKMDDVVLLIGSGLFGLALLGLPLLMILDFNYNSDIIIGCEDSDFQECECVEYARARDSNGNYEYDYCKEQQEMNKK